MAVFVQHVGEKGGRRDFPKSIGTHADGLKQFRLADVDRYLAALAANEKAQIERAISQLRSDSFQIWGLPSGAEQVTKRMSPGDWLLLLESTTPGGVFHYSGRVVAKLSQPMHDFSTWLWGEGKFSVIVLLTGDLTPLPWSNFLEKFGYKANYNPRGTTFELREDRIHKSSYRDIEEYLDRSLGYNFTDSIQGKIGFSDDGSNFDFQRVEGRRALAVHLRLERSRALIEKFKKSLSSFACAACGFDFETMYGELGASFVEAHHVNPVASMADGSVTHLSDLIPLCANCHRMIHRGDPILSLSDLKSRIKGRK